MKNFTLLQNVQSFRNIFAIRYSTSSYYVTTPIFYVNGDPHIGHYYTSLIADCLNRYMKLSGKANETIFSVGTDEHGLKIQQSANKAGIDYAQYASNNSKKFEDLFNKGAIDYSYFVRTTHDNHKAAVTKFWNELMDKKYIYKGKYEGWYCVPDEAFLGSNDVVETMVDGKSKMLSVESNHEVEWMSEENYMFTLSRFKNDILHWLGSHDDVIRPRKFYNIVKRLLEDDLPDLSVSRPTSRLEWGIKVPGDSSQTIYVWLDALVNYLTVAGYPDKNLKKWPPDCQIIGKDILKFHAIYWPAFLIAIGLEPPRQILCHSHWVIGNEKMSKSKGNFVDPINRFSRYSVDGLRYFLLARGVPFNDGNYKDDKIVDLLNAELMGIIGNLYQRISAVILNPDGIFYCCEHSTYLSDCGQEGLDIIEATSVLPASFEKNFSEFSIYKAIQDSMNCLRMCNMFLQNQAPWALRRDPDQSVKVQNILYTVLETLRVCCILMQPVLPNSTDDILSRLSIPECERLISNLECFQGYNNKVKSIHEGRKLTIKKKRIFYRVK